MDYTDESNFDADSEPSDEAPGRWKTLANG
jgi:hypothetical protein